MKSAVKITATGLMILFFSFAVFAIAPQLSIFNDGNFDKTLYTNKTSNASINIEKNVTIISAVFNVTEVDLGVANYEQSYNLYTVSVRNGTDEILAAGSGGYIAAVNKTNGSELFIVYNSETSYIRGSDFKQDGSEALFVDDQGYAFIYNASTKTITRSTSRFASYLRDVAYSLDGSFAIMDGDSTDPIIYYNSSTKTFTNITSDKNQITIALDISPNMTEFISAGWRLYSYNITCGRNLSNTNNWNNCSTEVNASLTRGILWRGVGYKPDGTEALIAGDYGNVFLYNSSTRTATALTTGTTLSFKSINYASDGSRAVIVGDAGIARIFNSTCNPVLCNLTTGMTVNLNSVEFENSTTAYIAGSGRTLLRYNAANEQVTILRNGTSGILYHVASRPNTDEALIVGDEGQVFKYNFTTKTITTLNSTVFVQLRAVQYNWNGTEALIVGDSGVVLRYNPINDSFISINNSLIARFLDVSYRNGTNEALIAGVNSTLLVYNSTCNGISSSLCRINLSGNFPDETYVWAVSFNPSGTLALFGGWGAIRRYNATSGAITTPNGQGANMVRIVWKPNGNEALLAGGDLDHYQASSCSQWGQGCEGGVSYYNTTTNNVSQSYGITEGTVWGASYSPEGNEALFVGENGKLFKYNSSLVNQDNLTSSITELSSGTNGILFGVAYRQDGITNEAIIVVGDNKQILFYDGEKVMTNPEVFLGTARIWNFTGNYNGTTLINFTSNLTAYLSTCSADANGICSVPFSVNATTQTSIMRFHSINITYNHAPVLLSSIPNQSWNQDTDTTINLTAYFNDSDRDVLTYGNTAVTSITISINQTTGIVTLTPSSGFYGTRYIIFNATDSINLTNSNNITLTINQVISPSPSGGTSGGGGGSAACYPRWICASWGYCINNTETRECIDANKCSSKAKPETTRNCTYEIMPEAQTGGIPAGAVLIEEKKSSSSMLKPVSCTKQDKSRISIIREFNIYEVKRGDSIEYKSVISLTIENTGEDEATNIEIKEIIPEIMLQEPSLTFSVEGITLKGNTLRYNIQHLNAKEKAYLNYSVNAKIDGSAISQTPRAVTGFSIIDTRFNPFTFISGIPSFIFKVVWSLLSIAFFLSLAITAIHWIKYGNLDTKAWKLGIILLLPIIMSIFDFALANYLILLAVMPIAVVELFVFVRNRRIE